MCLLACCLQSQDRIPCPRHRGVFSPAWGATCSRHSANTCCIREQRNAGHQPSPRGTLLTNPPVTLEEPLSSCGPPCPPLQILEAWLCECWLMAAVGCFPGGAKALFVPMVPGWQGQTKKLLPWVICPIDCSWPGWSRNRVEEGRTILGEARKRASDCPTLQGTLTPESRN